LTQIRSLQKSSDPLSRHTTESSRFENGTHCCPRKLVITLGVGCSADAFHSRARSLSLDPLATTHFRFSRFGRTAIDFMEKAIVQDPAERVSCSELLAHNFFIEGGFVESFLPELRELLDEPPLTIDPPAASSRVGPTTRAPTHKPRSPSPHIISPTPMSTSPVAAAKHKGPTTGFTKPGGSSTFGGSFKSTNGFGQARAPGFVASVSTSPSPKKPSGGTLSSTKPTRNAPRFRTLPTAAQKSPGVFSKKPGGVGQGGAIVRGVKASSLKTFRGSDKKKFLPSLGP
jgi:serine/threonine protein kinase